MSYVTRRIGWLILVLAVGCVSLTVHVHFPAAEIRSALEEIEADVRSTESPTSWLPRHRSMLAGLIPFRISFGPTPVYAQKSLDLAVETPTILSIKKQRKERFKKIDPYLANGILGEGRTGYLVIRDQKGLSLKERGALKRLVKEENNDRKKMYLAILSANGLPKEDLEQIEKLAAQAIRKVLKPGRWYEIEKDKWVQKKKKKEDTEKEGGEK